MHRIISARIAPILLGFVFSGSVFPTAVRAGASPPGGPDGLEVAILREVAAGRVADVPDLCRQASGDPGSAAAKDRPCFLSGSFLRKVITHAKDYETDPATSIALRGAEFEGPVDLADLLIDRPIHLAGGKVKGDVDLSRAKAARAVSFRDVEFDGDFEADGLISDFGLDLSDSAVVGTRSISLKGAVFKGRVDLEHIVGEAAIVAEGLQVDSSLDLSRSRVEHIALQGARVAGSLSLNGVVALKGADLSRIQVGSTLFAKAIMDGCRPANPVLGSLMLARGRIALDVQMNGLEVRGPLDFADAEIGRDLFLQSQGADHAAGDCNQADVPAVYDRIELHYTDVHGSLQMDRAEVHDDFSAVEMKVGGDLSSRGVHFFKDVTMANATVGGNLDLQGSRLADLDLSGAAVAGTAHFANDDPAYDPVNWLDGQSRSGLTLTNARLGILAGALRAPPPSGMLHLSGAVVSHIPVGSETETGAWDRWIRLDSRYAPSMYEQISAAFASAGFGDKADEIRFAGRVRQMDEQKGVDWWVSCVLLYVACFGIGVLTFRVLYWILVITVAGAIYLHVRRRPTRRAEPQGAEPRNDGSRSLAWCLGATLSRLLPIVEINREFTDFFNDPRRERLTGFQSSVFSLIGLLGWLFGIILLGAVSGLLGKA